MAVRSWTPTSISPCVSTSRRVACKLSTISVVIWLATVAARRVWMAARRSSDAANVPLGLTSLTDRDRERRARARQLGREGAGDVGQGARVHDRVSKVLTHGVCEAALRRARGVERHAPRARLVEHGEHAEGVAATQQRNVVRPSRLRVLGRRGKHIA